NSVRMINSNGVSTLPTKSTTLLGTIEKHHTTTKNAIDDQTGLACGKDGSIPTSKVVAAVRGIAINGPIQIMIIVPKTAAKVLFIRWPKSLKSSPELVTARIPVKGRRIPERPNAKIVNHM